jgi:hypothetical protein
VIHEHISQSSTRVCHQVPGRQGLWGVALCTHEQILHGIFGCCMQGFKLGMTALPYVGISVPTLVHFSLKVRRQHVMDMSHMPHMICRTDYSPFLLK